MLLRIDCPDCRSEYAWQMHDTKYSIDKATVEISLRCTACGHFGMATADNDADKAAAGAVATYRIQTTAKEETDAA
jgi:C4-type Zn-finger protein